MNKKNYSLSYLIKLIEEENNIKKPVQIYIIISVDFPTFSVLSYFLLLVTNYLQVNLIIFLFVIGN